MVFYLTSQGFQQGVPWISPKLNHVSHARGNTIVPRKTKFFFEADELQCTEPAHGTSGTQPIPSENILSYNSKEIVDGRSTVGLDNTGFELDISSKEIHPRSHDDMNSSPIFSQPHKGGDRSLTEKGPLPEIPKTNIDQSALQESNQRPLNSYYDKVDEQNKSDCCGPVQGGVTTIFDSIDILASKGTKIWVLPHKRTRRYLKM